MSATSNKKRTPTYMSWDHMIQRCVNPNNVGFHNYGGRGIRVCARWRNYKNFVKDMGERPKNTSLDRVDTNGDYEPGNCRWASRTHQNINRRLDPRNTTGTPGVRWDARLSKYCIYISVGNKHRHVGVSTNLAEAIRLRKHAEATYRKEMFL